MDRIPPSQNSLPKEVERTRKRGWSYWLQDPLGSVVTASAATIGSLGLVLSGIWFINLAVT